ncbi:hypothetical protein ARMGADRAFT_285184 [Armillaria gallica]|uniref:Uncharacterized protein n=1 Tax=Armillaria gallica TaxID=47427 RepID=A0A2H3D703_ARMGA|nr:hypothetical protein ARMGADRAFT_285184 [Armillaria gallica]
MRKSGSESRLKLKMTRFVLQSPLMNDSWHGGCGHVSVLVLHIRHISPKSRQWHELLKIVHFSGYRELQHP